MSNQIPNILQTVQERTIIKSAPDIVVYLDGLPFLINAYNKSEYGDFQIVPINSFVDSFSADYDVDQLIPSCTVSFTVPNHQKYMFKAPGGDNILQAMMELQVFCKGYYPSSNGNTLYHRVFWGLVSSVSYTDTSTVLNISISGSGILKFFQMMTIDLRPAAITNADGILTVHESKQYGMNPLEIIKDTFIEDDFAQSFMLFTVYGSSVDSGGSGAINIKDSPYWNSINRGMVTKWLGILKYIRQHVHLFGLKSMEKVTEASPRQKTVVPAEKPEASKKVPTVSESDLWYNYAINDVQRYLPDFGFGEVQLINGRLMSRLDRVRSAAETIGYEGYQDLDGRIVFKPPLYNLDVTQINSIVSTDASDTGQNSALKITSLNNPFIVQQVEMGTDESEAESEDGIKMTRIQVYGNPVPQIGQTFTIPAEISPAAQFIDPAKMIRFGLREQAPVQLSYVGMFDTIQLFGLAASELQRANRGWRTYSFSIPLRPELKLGFPMFIPHRDMYGYIKNLSISYHVGGDATMRVTLDTIRKRPMFPVSTTVTDSSGNKHEVQSLQPQPDLIWVQTKAAPPNASSQTSKADPPHDPAAALTLLGMPGTIPSYMDMSHDQKKYVDFKNNVLKNWYGTTPDGPNSFFVVSQDKDNLFTNPALVDDEFMKKIQGNLPYTDAKGYEVLSPFPWGRYASVNEAVQTFLNSNYIQKGESSTPAIAQVSGTDALLFSGIGTGITPSTTGGDALKASLNYLTNTIVNHTVIEITSPTSIGSTAAPSATLAQELSGPNTQNAASVLVSGTSPTPAAVQTVLQTILPVPTTGLTLQDVIPDKS